MAIRVLLVTPTDSHMHNGESAFPGCDVERVATVAGLQRLSKGSRRDFAFVDIAILRQLVTGSDPEASLDVFRQFVPGARVVVLSERSDIREAVGFVRAGASDYLAYPLIGDEVLLTLDGVQRHEAYRSEISFLKSHEAPGESPELFETRSEAMKAAMHKLRQVAPTRSTVLLTGETGTGKSFLAKLIHQRSVRADRQLISVHCGAIPDPLLESELFGHEKGAFTGAVRRKAGKFEIADGGTLFLDEVATISPAMQVKLLNVLQERIIQRVGGERDIVVDVRIVAATNVDLAELSRDGRFRPDLFYRLNVFPIEVPPLRERREDIPRLTKLFLARLGRLYGKEITSLDAAVAEAYQAYSWPGNVRELENLLERAFILESGDRLSPGSFPQELFSESSMSRVVVDLDAGLAEVRRRAADQAERVYLEEQLVRHQGRIDATAAAAAMTPRQLHKLMTKHGLRKEDFKRSARSGIASSES